MNFRNLSIDGKKTMLQAGAYTRPLFRSTSALCLALGVHVGAVERAFKGVFGGYKGASRV